MRKLFTAIVIVGVLALFAGSAFAASATMVVRANVPAVWELDWQNTTSDFGDLSTNNLSNSAFFGANEGWKNGTPLRFYIRTNRDYQVQFGGNIDHLRTTFDNLGGGNNPAYKDNRFTGNVGGKIYNSSSTGHTNAVIQTQYQVEVSMTWYDNGKADGPYAGTPIPYRDADLLQGAYVNDTGSGPNIWTDQSSTSYDHHWTGGARGTFWIKPRIRPLGLGQQPGYYVGDFTFYVTPHQWDGIS